MLEARQRGILTTIAEIERKDLDPLTTLEDRINGELDKTVECIEKGKDLLNMYSKSEIPLIIFVKCLLKPLLDMLVSNISYTVL